MGRLAAIVALVAAAAPSAAVAASLYDGPGSRPGPDLLYAKRPVAPQLTNRKPWRAKPILVSGTTSYRAGEFLYQDFLYDDSGAQLARDSGDPKEGPGGLSNLFSKHNGTYTYPTASGYANNAADLVELRVKPLRRATAFRVTLNTLKDRSLVAFTLALGGKARKPRELPFGANVKAPADVFLTVHPAGARTVGELTAPGGRRRGSFPTRVDMRRRQFEVRVPHRAWSPRRRTVRMAAGIGLWDAAEKRYLLPGRAADEGSPGGAGDASRPAAFFNVAFRSGEPIPSPTENERAVVDPAWWRDRAQGEALAAGDISRFFANVDFRKLARRVRDDRHVPKTGPIDRILASRFELAQGADFTHRCITRAATCPGQYQGRLQPYSIYVPKKPRPARGYGMTLLLHSLAANYNQYHGTRNQSQFGERDAGSIVITPEARGPDEFYENYGAADVFEVWSDVARRYKLDPDWTVAAGYSMGGIGSFKLAAQYPDLFARIQPTVGFESDAEVLPSLRNVPVLMWNNHGDELVNNASFQATADALDRLGYRYELDAFQPCAHPRCSALFPSHLQLAVNDSYGPAAQFLGDARVERNPAYVTFVRFPPREHPELGMVADHAYWVSDIKLAEGADTAKVELFTRGLGKGQPETSGPEPGSGTLEGGHLGTLSYTSQKRTWTVGPGKRENLIGGYLTGIRSLTIDVARAGVDCDVELEVGANVERVPIKLAGCDRVVERGFGTPEP